MIKIYLVLLLVITTISAISQKPLGSYDHLTLNVHNLDSSVAFYTSVFGFDTIPCPFPSDATRRLKWLKISKYSELHLIENFGDTTTYNNTSFHLGFKIASIDALVKRLNEVSSDYKSGKYKQPSIGKMPYGARMIFIQDPNGYSIHLIEASQ